MIPCSLVHGPIHRLLNADGSCKASVEFAVERCLVVIRASLLIVPAIVGRPGSLTELVHHVVCLLLVFGLGKGVFDLFTAIQRRYEDEKGTTSDNQAKRPRSLIASVICQETGQLLNRAIG